MASAAAGRWPVSGELLMLRATGGPPEETQEQLSATQQLMRALHDFGECWQLVPAEGGTWIAVERPEPAPPPELRVITAPSLPALTEKLSNARR